jgi:hypothetical protein
MRLRHAMRAGAARVTAHVLPKAVRNQRWQQGLMEQQEQGVIPAIPRSLFLWPLTQRLI